jgi:inhibitor of KinA
MEITPLGDSALILRVCENLEDAPDAAIRRVLRVRQCLENARLPGVIETAPASTSVALFYDTAQVLGAGARSEAVFDWLASRINDVIANADEAPNEQIESRLIEIPVCYEAEFAPDLDDVAKRAGLLVREVVDLHSSAEYRVNCIGFTPGFPYLSGLPNELATPRRATPRKEIPAGSVAIGGTQTGIYSVKSPGGWNVIGRTPLRLFDPAKTPPALLRVGDRVRLRAVTREEFEREMQC